MCSDKARPTVDELYQLLKRSSLPTVLVEGKDDIIFYRKIEEELKEYGVDMLPAGNKDSVLALRQKIREQPISAPVVFVVDKDLWVHEFSPSEQLHDVITTEGYSIENDLFVDGDLESLLDAAELARYRVNLEKFVRWYALALSRHINHAGFGFRTHPNKILDDEEFYRAESTLTSGEAYPIDLYNEIYGSYSLCLRGKSLFALMLRELAAKRREIKFSGKQLMAFGASRKGPNFQRLYTAIKNSLEQSLLPQ